MHAEEFFKGVLDNLYDGVYFVDRFRRITYWNKGAERISGYSAEQVIGHSCADNLLMHIDDDGNLLCLAGCPLSKTIADGQPREADVYMHHADGHRVPVTVRATPMRDDSGKIIGAVEVFADSSSKLRDRERMEELKKAALYDELTSLGNRRYIAQQLANSLRELKDHGLPFGLVFIDIDHFKKINDTYGHPVGDLILKMVANSLQLSLRPYDEIGRWGGEEFLILLPNVNEENLYNSAERMRILVANSRLTQPDGKNIEVTISIGATTGYLDDTAETIIERADRLLYQSKFLGRNQTSVRLMDYTP